MKPVFKAATIEISDEAKREISFIASDETVDRYGDIIRVAGWDFSNFKKNPVLLFGHQSSKPPIGTVPDVKVEGKKVLAKANFLPEGVYDFADTIWKIIKAKALRAVSVGFMPTEEPNKIRDEKNDWVIGYEYIAQELLELSVVPVPANPNALAIARGLDLNEEYIKQILLEGSASAFIASKRREIALLSVRAS